MARNAYLLVCILLVGSCSCKTPSGGSSSTYYSEQQLIEVMNTCSFSNDIIRVLGRPFQIVDYSDGDVLLVYFAEEHLGVIDNIGGVSIRLSPRGEIVSWNPVLTHRGGEPTVYTYDPERELWRVEQ